MGLQLLLPHNIIVIIILLSQLRIDDRQLPRVSVATRDAITESPHYRPLPPLSPVLSQFLLPQPEGTASSETDNGNINVSGYDMHKKNRKKASKQRQLKDNLL